MTPEARVEYCRQKSQAWREANRERHREYTRKWGKANAERKAVANRKWAERNADKMASYRREWVKRDPERARQTWHRWRHANPDTVNAATQRRRAKLRRLEGHYTAQEWKDLCVEYGHLCACCGKQKRLTVDHVIPVSKGGVNRIDNIQPLCRECNSAKGMQHD